MASLDQFLLFGDSITQVSSDQSQGFACAAALQHEYILRLDVINRGFSGYTTKDALTILSNIFPSPSHSKVRFLTILFGTNDAILLRDGRQHVSVADYNENLRALLSHHLVTAHVPNLHIILITPPPIEESIIARLDAEWGFPDPIRRQQKNTALYAEIVRQVGKDTGTVVLDLWQIFMEKAGWREGSPALPGTIETGINDALAGLLSDGVHFTPAGYRMMFEGVMKTIEHSWPDQMPEQLPTLYVPPQAFVDPQN